jgi:hypothetical protein
MIQRKSWLLAILLLALGAPVLAQKSVEGIWRVEFVSPQGQVGLNMTINQTGSKLTGRVTDEYGEWPIEGRIADSEVTVVWTVPEDGKLLEITMKGTLEGSVITGTAKLGDIGEGPLTARRTGDASDVVVR